MQCRSNERWYPLKDLAAPRQTTEIMPSFIQAINDTVVAFVSPTNPDTSAGGDDSGDANTGPQIPIIVLPAILLGSELP